MLSLLVPVDDPTAGEVVRRELDDDPVLGKDPDVVLSHLAADVGEDLVAVAQLDPEHRVRESFDNCALDLDHAFFLRHVLRNLVATSADLVYRWPGNRPAWRRRATPAGGPRGTVGEPLPAQPSELSFTGLDRAAVGRHETGPRWADTSVYVKVRANPNRRSMPGRRNPSDGHCPGPPRSSSRYARHAGRPAPVRGVTVPRRGRPARRAARRRRRERSAPRLPRA